MGIMIWDYPPEWYRNIDGIIIYSGTISFDNFKYHGPWDYPPNYPQLIISKKTKNANKIPTNQGQLSPYSCHIDQTRRCSPFSTRHHDALDRTISQGPWVHVDTPGTAKRLASQLLGGLKLPSGLASGKRLQFATTVVRWPIEFHCFTMLMFHSYVSFLVKTCKNHIFITQVISDNPTYGTYELGRSLIGLSWSPIRSHWCGVVPYIHLLMLVHNVHRQIRWVEQVVTRKINKNVAISIWIYP
jgi:hypothetical protein